MTKTVIVNILLIVSLTLHGQTNLPAKVSDYIRMNYLQPLNRVDTVSKVIPKNTVTKSGWHIDYYARLIQEDGTQLNGYTIIYKDSIFHSSWYPENPRSIDYKKYYDTLIKETSDFLYFSKLDPVLGDNIFIVSKRMDNISFQFNNLVGKDIDKGIYLTYSYSHCQAAKRPYLMATNIKTEKSIEIKFGGYCDNEKNWCVETFAYLNGVLTITVNVTNKKRNKFHKETKSIKI